MKRDKIQDKKIMTDEDMIKHLKGKGYKIMKRVKEWVEC
jgi:hypothetical protein